MISQEGINLIKQFEGLKLVAYKDSVGIWTIGYGTIKYPSGIRVKQGDTCNMLQANEYLRHDIEDFEEAVDKLVKSNVNQNQIDALISFTYNLGPTNLSNSTLLKKVNVNPNDPTIKAEFLKWNKGKVDGQSVVINGLTRRRQLEAELYFKK